MDRACYAGCRMCAAPDSRLTLEGRAALQKFFEYEPSIASSCVRWSRQLDVIRTMLEYAYFANRQYSSAQRAFSPCSVLDFLP